jgi:hypothetical protein
VSLELGHYYYSAGEGERRRWADMTRYGFISAGGGRWHSRTLRALRPGHRVWAHIPKVGYVGAGHVTASVVPVVESGLLGVDLEAPASVDARAAERGFRGRARAVASGTRVINFARMSAIFDTSPEGAPGVPAGAS